MSKRIFTGEQIKKLLTNENIARCSEKSITYQHAFKTDAVKLYAQGLTPSEIFAQANFDLQIIGQKAPTGCLKRWNRTCRITGVTSLSAETRGRGGGRPKTKYQTDKEQIKYLEAQVAYLKAENDFLAKLRASKKR